MSSQKNNFLYGGLNQKVANNTYVGGETSTTTTYVDNVNNIITVDANIDIDALEQEMETVRKQYREISQDCSKLKVSVEELKNADEELARSIVKLDAKVDKNVTKLNTKIDTTKSELSASIASTKSQLEASITAGDTALESHINAVDSRLTQTIADTKSQLEAEIQQVAVTVEQQIQPKLNALDAKITQVETSLNSRITTEVSSLQSQITQLGSDIQELRSDVQKLIDQKISKIEKDLADLKTYVDTTITTQIQQVTQRVDTVDGRITTVEGTVSNLNNRVTTVEEKVDSIGTKYDHKAEGMYYDASGILDPKGEGKSYWYMSYDVNNMPTSLITTKEGKYIAYDFGSGGGGGGGGGGTVSTDVKINGVNWPSTIAEGTKCELVVNWSSTREGQSTGNGTLAVYIDEQLLVTLKNQPQGNVTLDLTKYLSVGINSVEVRAVDVYGNMNRYVKSVTIVQISLSSSFSGTDIYGTNIEYKYTPVAATEEGAIEKTVYFIIDGEADPPEIVKDSGQQKTHIISGLKHGSHKLKVYFTCNISGNVVQSNSLNYDLIVCEDGKTSPIIASEFVDLQQEQYISFTIPYRVFTPPKEQEVKSNVTLYVNDAVVAELTGIDWKTQYWEYRATEPGNYKMEIKTGTVVKRFDVVVKEATIDVQAVSEDLALYLNATGRQNTDPNRDIWEFTDSRSGTPKTIRANFYNFNWVSDGWLKDSNGNTMLRISGDARVVIPFQIFKSNDVFKNSGRTIEIEFSTTDVMDYESTIIACLPPATERQVGLKVSAQEAFLYSTQTDISSKYKENEHIRLTFVIEKNTETDTRRLVRMYLNGILCGIKRYPTTDSFAQSYAYDLQLGSSNATTDIYCIRVYDNDLTSRQVVNNWIADTQSGELKKERFIRNDNYNSVGKITTGKLPSNLPYLIVSGERLSDGKKDKVKVDTKYVNPNNSKLNYTSDDSQLYVQGTSSANYYRKNYRINYASSGFIQDGVQVAQYAFREGSIPVDLFTYKADVASSEGANNVELVRLYEDASPVDTPAKKENSKVRMGIDGIPAIMFFNNTTEGTTELYSKVNFNNDKANENLYGFQEGDECWEFLNNNTAYCLFKEDTQHTWDEEVWSEEEQKMVHNWQRSFEGRYPDGNTNTTKLKALVDWVTSTRRLDTDTEEQKAAKLAKFKNELENYFNLDNTLYYYLFTELFLLVDSRAKNAFPAYYKSRTPGDGGDRWFWIPYDMDTAIGTNNEGALQFDYSKIDTDKLSTGSYVFNCQDSPMWANLRDAYQPELSALYTKLRSGKKIDYDFIENRFEEHQGAWSENIFNEDSHVKYIEPLDKLGTELYLSMAQGSKEQQRKWWLYNRFKYIDSKYNTASATEKDKIIFRYYAKANMTITPYADVYAAVSFASGNVVKERATRGNPVVLVNPVENPDNTECSVYSASQLSSIGSLAELQVDSVDISAATRLQSLKLGDPVIHNTHLGIAAAGGTAISIGNNKLLKYFDVRNCDNLRDPIDLSNCTGLKEVYCEGSKIPSVAVPNGGSLEVLHLPNSVSSIELRNQPSIRDFTIVDPTNLKLDRLWLENVPGSVYNVRELIANMQPHRRIRIMGINETVHSIAEITSLYELFDRLWGITSTGGEIDKAQVQGTIYLKDETISYDKFAELTEKYPQITIVPETMLCKVQFWNEGVEYGQPQLVYAGFPATKPTPDPEKPWTPYDKYTFTGWDKDFSNVQTNMDINAVYKREDRYFSVQFDLHSTIPTPIPTQYWKYQEHADKPDDPYISEMTPFLGWFKRNPQTGEQYTDEFKFDPVTKKSIEEITEDIILDAKWQDLYAPSATIDITGYNEFKFTLRDNVAITAYKITDSEEVPTTWNYIHPAAVVENYYTVQDKGRYYVHCKDAEDKKAVAWVDAFSIIREAAKGTDIKLFYTTEQEVDSVVLQNRKLTVDVTLDSHYHDLKIYCNDVEITNGSTIQITQNTVIKTTCIPDQYTCEFINNGHGVKPPTQIINYDPESGLVQAPDPQYVDKMIIIGWYEDPTFQGDAWNFGTDIITKNTVLYANWQVYSEPTKIKVVFNEPVRVACSFYQSESNGVVVDWGDSSPTSQSSSGGKVVKLYHTYETAPADGFDILLTCISGQYYPGGGSSLEPAISPAYTVREVKFALNAPCAYPYGFANCTNLSKVQLTSYMPKIEIGTFQNCTALSSIELPNEIKTISAYAFDGCKALTGRLRIPSSCTSIGQHAFQNCTGITLLDIPETITSIDQGAFMGCKLLRGFNIPSNLARIATNLFRDCEALTELSIPQTVTNLGDSCFAGCKGLKKLEFLGTYLTCGANCFSGCTELKTAGPFNSQVSYDIKFNFVNKIPDNIFQSFDETLSCLQTVVIPEGIEEIGSGAFSNSAVGLVTLPTTLKTIGDSAFSGCPGNGPEGSVKTLSLTLPGSLKTLGANVFYQALGIKNISIPASVTTIGNNIFYGCSELQRVEIHCTSSSKQPTKASESWFWNASSTTDLHVRSNLDTSHAFGDYWNFYSLQGVIDAKKDLES